ncbi:Sec-independent protein translocase protein TatA/B/E [Dillenia turbinata]|uniref:Sec-independent protein translocase protein TatA/B/E n=1 Tax=Dillenia turbinata TaxID=194707 RepID=A0AAN8V909_9MAGN
MTTVMIGVMASTISSSPTYFSSSSSKRIPRFTLSSSSTCVCSKTPNLSPSTSSSVKGLACFSQWSGLRHLGISTRQKYVRAEKRGRCKGMVVYASLFGVGAPEALVIGVVALLVFGPKGLAEVARNLGKTLRAFQPTIRELQEVSREFKSTLEREIGIDEIQNSTQSTYTSSITNTTPSTSSPAAKPRDSETVIDPSAENGSKGGVSSPNKAYSSEDYLKITEEQLKAATQQQQQTPLVESQTEYRAQAQGIQEANASAMPPNQKPE